MGGKNKLRTEMGVKFGNMEYFSVARVGKKETIWVGLPWWLSRKESTSQCRGYGCDPWVGKIPWRRKWQPTPVFLPGKFHGQNLAGRVYGLSKSWI